MGTSDRVFGTALDSSRRLELEKKDGLSLYDDSACSRNGGYMHEALQHKPPGHEPGAVIAANLKWATCELDRVRVTSAQYRPHPSGHPATSTLLVPQLKLHSETVGTLPRTTLDGGSQGPRGLER